MTETSNLDDLPLFPLGSVLFPGGSLPLRIFEVRYLDMIGRCQKTGMPFGVVCLIEGSEVRLPGVSSERFAPVGTLATIRAFAAPHAGLLQIECLGTRRFRSRQSTLQKHGLWTASVELLADDLVHAVPADLEHTALALRQLVQALERRRVDDGEAHMPMPFAEPYGFDDCGWLANRWCELLPLASALKQQLMALDSPLMRLELVSDLLARTGIAT
ncbi:MAG: LON peptidase substrate-binding domain-containing protein [Variovorax sp.]